MKIIYCSWGEWSKDDVIDTLGNLGHEVIKYEEKVTSFISDEDYESGLEVVVKNESPDAIFTMNYLPIVSEVANKNSVNYVSYIYDCPHLTLYSKTVLNRCNFFFAFDRKMAEELAGLGAENVYHCPLAVNTTRLEKTLGEKKYDADVTFLGTLYEDDNNHFDKIAGVPDYIRGFVDALVSSQQLFWGYDMTSDIVSDDMCDEILKHAVFDLGETFFDAKREIVRDWIRKKVTVAERRGLIDKLCKAGIKVDLYAPEKPENLGVNYKGYANYYSQMPLIFNQSKINLNITLRSIQSGVPLRVIDILGAGGFCLTNYQPEIAELFENEVELVMYDGPEDLVEKSYFYLEHEDARERIARAGLSRARADFSYEKKLEWMLGRL